ncbi:EAL domain-containing protein [Nocardioides iriomotensis]|uniref:EAL domain-containing protein n=1 Tax=Nocardioides iriomotensis TaxID=715784 RepID=A0A4Q5IZ97_9ACTN|nr:EAL domain-containing protein [Nocardioides iriomotensis]RYU11482.1 EAL domain-containing protein [Nocardioides iriomotensis]
MSLTAGWAADVLQPAGEATASRDLVAKSLTAVRVHLGMEVAFVGRFQDGRRHFAFVDSDPGFVPIRAGESDEIEATYCARVVDGRLPELIPDAGALRDTGDLPVMPFPVGAQLSVPLRRLDGTAFGTLCCFSRTPDDRLRRRDLNLLRLVADVIEPHVRFLISREESADLASSRVVGVLSSGGPQIALQPIVDLRTDRVAGFEALARFPDDVGWTPDQWFAEAHGVRYGVTLESAAVAAALRTIDRLPEDAMLAVNVSAEALCADEAIAAMVADGPAARVVVELTEHQRVPRSDLLDARLAALREAGARIAVDDAGSGYAGLEHILHLRPEVLKLDRVLVQGVAHHAGRRAMCEAMVQFTRSTGVLLVAEGVETEPNLEVLRALGVDLAQGFLLGRPTVW